ncbi:SubName: Full=Uncharacterized protein {ECO:0000313/EMBL:CCA73313.1} [Serendipita indica DSM 11827]|nr:SubName: Full=Uncharacterized protein {ECO:0000313/EMBL:CCA73313.1} [Serendipita indica DSM 11827]
MVRILTGADVCELIAHSSFTDELVRQTRNLFYRLSGGQGTTLLQCPERSKIVTDEWTLLTMPGHDGQLTTTTVKLVTVPAPNSRRSSSLGLAASTVVLDRQTGGIHALVNARHLTALRTAAGSLVATQLLWKCPLVPVTLALFGAGLQIEYHARLLLDYFPSIETCYIVNRTATRAHALVSRLQTTQATTTTTTTRAIKFECVDEYSDHLKPADILVCATSSFVPLIEDRSIRSGAHLILVGSYTPQMHEVSTQTILRASAVVVDSAQHALHEAGELIDAQPHPVLELGQLLHEDGTPNHTMIQRASTGQLTIFKSVGLALQDVLITHLVCEAAQARSIGTIISDFDG